MPRLCHALLRCDNQRHAEAGPAGGLKCIAEHQCWALEADSCGPVLVTKDLALDDANPGLSMQRLQ